MIAMCGVMELLFCALDLVLDFKKLFDNNSSRICNKNPTRRQINSLVCSVHRPLIVCSDFIVAFHSGPMLNLTELHKTFCHNEIEILSKFVVNDLWVDLRI